MGHDLVTTEVLLKTAGRLASGELAMVGPDLKPEGLAVLHPWILRFLRVSFNRDLKDDI